MSSPTPGSAEWLAQVQEPILDADRAVIDPHHHLWRPNAWGPYLLADLRGDTDSGHHIEKTVFVECRASYLDGGPEHLKPIGETQFVAAIAAASRADGKDHAAIVAIVAHADLTRGDAAEEVLAAHNEAGAGLLRGVRHAGARAENPDGMFIAGRAPAGLYAMPAFRDGVRLLGRLGYTYDTWHYHYQNAAFADLARAAPGTTMILDHFGTPLGIGAYAEQREEIFVRWQKDIVDIAKCPNVVAKLGGLAMPDNGFGWDKRDHPATSDELVAAQSRYYHHAIDCFGPARCMFESNFPVDKRSLSYHVYWNGMKKIAARYTQAEQHELFYGTAARVYRI